jgi:hypothetical protein
MKLRLALGIVIVLYAVVGLLVRFSDMALGYYQNLISAVESNGPISSLLTSLLSPFPSVLLTLLWFGLAGFLGVVLVFYRSLLKKEKPVWTRPSLVVNV